SNDIVPMTKAYLAASAIDMIEDVVYLYRERPGASSMTAKAESATALVSYLTQELACAELVRAAGSANLSRAYATLVFERDGWVHLAKYLRAAGRDRAQEGTVASLINQIVVVTGRDPARFKDRYKRLLFTLVRNGEIDVAAGLSGAVTGPDVGAARKVRGWADLLAAVEKRGRGLDADERQLLPRIITDVALAISTGTADADDDILRATRTLATSAADRLRGVPELAGIDGDADDPTLQTRFAATRGLNATLTDLTMGRAIRFTITGLDPAGVFIPVVFVEGDPTVIRARHSRRIDSDGTTTWEAQVSAGAIGVGRAIRVALLDTATGNVSSTRLAPAATTPPYNRLDPFLLMIDDRGVRLTRRSGLVSRAAKQGAARILPSR
ncbi:MAG: hypothetical protein ABW091_15725, partial [Microbacterium sp.]